MNNMIESKTDFENAQNKKNFEQKTEILNDQALDPNMKVKKNYTRKTLTEKDKMDKKSQNMKLQECPKCLQRIKVIDWKNHMKICLKNTKEWLAQKQDRDYRATLPALAEGDEITKNLKRFASQRPDLSGVDVPIDAAEAGQQPQTKIWDGQSSNLTRTHANVLMMQNQQK